MREPGVAHRIEIWHTPTVGEDQVPVLLEVRKFDPASDPPKVYQLANGTLLVAATTERIRVGMRYRYRVRCVELSD